MNKEKKIKCVIWDLDNTIWDGVLVEDKDVKPFEDVVDCIKKLDERGIINSIASRNDYEDAMARLKVFMLDQYFIYPQIWWGDKSESVERIIGKLGISADTVAFVDDQLFEIDEVQKIHPNVLCIQNKDIKTILENARFISKYITEDTKMRRQMYLTDIMRNDAEENFGGTREDFLCTLNMKVSISLAKESDLERLLELTERTSQLNTTGYTYSYDELLELSKSPDYRLLVVGLNDKYGTSGKIGLALIKITSDKEWIMELLIMSCRVLSRGIGTVLIDFILEKARNNGINVMAKFKKTSRNKMMYMTYAIAGFELFEQQNDLMILKHPMKNIRQLPKYIEIIDATN